MQHACDYYELRQYPNLQRLDDALAFYRSLGYVAVSTSPMLVKPDGEIVPEAKGALQMRPASFAAGFNAFRSELDMVAAGFRVGVYGEEERSALDKKAFMLLVAYPLVSYADASPQY
jgi:hypothetical protein